MNIGHNARFAASGSSSLSARGVEHARIDRNATVPEKLSAYSAPLSYPAVKSLLPDTTIAKTMKVSPDSPPLHLTGM
jgi:hypothetical protein